MSYSLARPKRLSLDSFAQLGGLHPEMVLRLISLGLLEADTDVSGTVWLQPNQLVVAARIKRLRSGFALNYAALGLVVDLLDRISELEAAVRHQSRSTGGRTWT